MLHSVSWNPFRCQSITNTRDDVKGAWGWLGWLIIRRQYQSTNRKWTYLSYTVVKYSHICRSQFSPINMWVFCRLATTFYLKGPIIHLINVFMQKSVCLIRPFACFALQTLCAKTPENPLQYTKGPINHNFSRRL